MKMVSAQALFLSMLRLDPDAAIAATNAADVHFPPIGIGNLRRTMQANCFHLRFNAETRIQGILYDAG
jgi:hypothetical protein